MLTALHPTGADPHEPARGREHHKRAPGQHKTANFERSECGEHRDERPSPSKQANFRSNVHVASMGLASQPITKRASSQRCARSEHRKSLPHTSKRSGHWAHGTRIGKTGPKPITTSEAIGAEWHSEQSNKFDSRHSSWSSAHTASTGHTCSGPSLSQTNESIGASRRRGHRDTISLLKRATLSPLATRNQCESSGKRGLPSH